MSHVCTTAGDEAGFWAYCVDCDWMGPVRTPAGPRERDDLPWWADAFYDMTTHS